MRMDYETFKQCCNQNKHEKDPYVLKSSPPGFKKAKHIMQRIDKLISDFPSFYKSDIWNEYVLHATDIKTTRALSVGNFEFRNGPDGGINVTMVPTSEKNSKRLFISPPPRCGKTSAMEAYKQFCEFMEENKMNNNVNKNLNNDLNNINWVVDSWEVEDRPFASVYCPCEFKVTLSGRLKNNEKQLNFYRLTNSLADKLNDKTCNTNSPTIKNVIFNDPATIVFWTDNTKTVVKCQDGEKFDPEKGITMAYFKKMHGNKGHYFEEIKKWTKQYYEKYPIDSNGVAVEFVANDWVEMARKLRMIAKLVTVQDYDNLVKIEDNKQLKELIDRELNGANETPRPVRYALFYAREDRGEDEGYTRHPVVYKYKASAVRAAKRLISKLPHGVEYTWFVDVVTD